MSTKRKPKQQPQPAEQQIPLVQLPPVRADIFEAAHMLIDHGRKAVALNSQAQLAVLAVTQWFEAAQRVVPQPPAPPVAPPVAAAEKPAEPAAANDAPAPAAPIPLNRAARRASARKGK